MIPPEAVAGRDMTPMPPRLAEERHRLATVLVADAVAFGRRMGEDDRAAVAALRECRALMSAAVKARSGKVRGTPGDFFLALMPSGIEAIEAALDIQAGLGERNLRVQAQSRAEYRIAIDIGDVHYLGRDVVGNAVNIASRLQGIAPSGAVVVSGAVYDVIGSREGFACEYLGDHVLKHVKVPVRVYAVGRAAPLAKPAPGAASADLYRDLHFLDVLPVKPIIEIGTFRAVDHTEDERIFADGVSEELVAMLTGLSNSLIVREAGAPAPPIETSRPGAPRHYKLSGSVRRTADGLQIIVHLIAPGTGERIWAERFEYRGNEAFDAQAVIAREVVTKLQVSLTEGEQARLWQGGTTNMRAWELFQRGHDLERRFTRHGHREARQCYAKALERDPNYVSALTGSAFIHLDEMRLGWTDDEEQSFAEAQALHDRAVAVAPNDPQCHAVRAYIELHRRNDRAAVAAMEESVRLAPRSGELAGYLGYVYDAVGRYGDAIGAYRRAMSLSSHYPAWIATNLGFALCVVGRLQEARKALLGVTASHPQYARAYLALAVAYSRLGLLEDAKQAAGELRRLDPLFAIADWARDRPYADPAVTEALAADMRRVGLG
jgi:class 3 adenylate cyclase/TolB-like protein/Tfp pilus assembly protein PilF